MAVGDTYVFPGFLTPVLTQLFFPKPPTTLLTYFCSGERRKYTGKKSRLNRGSNSQPPGHESDTLTTEPPGRGCHILGWSEWDLLVCCTQTPFKLAAIGTLKVGKQQILLLQSCFNHSIEQGSRQCRSKIRLTECAV